MKRYDFLLRYKVLRQGYGYTPAIKIKEKNVRGYGDSLEEAISQVCEKYKCDKENLEYINKLNFTKKGE